MSGKVNMLTESDILSRLPTSRSGFKRKLHPISTEQVFKELRIDEEGMLWWKHQSKGNARSLSKPAGSNCGGYRQIELKGYSFGAHVIAWVLYYGKWPSDGLYVDHINGCKTDNRKENLRLLTPSRNSLNKHKHPKNNTSGFVGVYSIKDSKWGAQIIVHGKRYYGGSYLSKEEAIHARLKLELKYELTAY